MASVVEKKNNFSVRAYVGDARTLLAFNLTKADAKSLAGFTIEVQPPEGPAYFLLNNLQFKTPADHAQDTSLPPTSSINAPFHKFRWLHVPGSAHQGVDPAFGKYVYTVTPRYFEDAALAPLDKSLSVGVTVDVGPFVKGKVSLGFTRGFTQSQAFVHHFGKNAAISPPGRTLLFPTSQQAGANAQGDKFTYEQEYGWLGFTARKQIFGLLNQVLDSGLHVDMFGYDLNEPDLMAILLKLAAQGRIRIILDDAALHHGAPKAKPTASGKTAKSTKVPFEDQFTTAFKKAAKDGAAIKRGKFARYSHDKIFIVSKDGSAATATKVLTGSTNFSVTGLYVNSNHVVVFDDPTVAATYADVFNTAWTGNVESPAFLKSSYSSKAFSFKSNGVPQTEVTFSPHAKPYALEVLKGVSDRIVLEGQKPKSTGSVLFAVMQLDGSDSTVYNTLANLHKSQSVFSYGISDTTSGIELYAPGSKQGVLVTGKPAGTVLPAPFDQVPGVGLGHQVHHKFVVCGFNDDDAVVYCGSSNLASGGEQQNGDNLIAIHDQDIATAFAVEAVGLVDHFNFLDKYAGKAQKAGKGTKAKAASAKKPASKTQAALDAHWFLDTDDKWTASYFDPNDLHFADRQMFA